MGADIVPAETMEVTGNDIIPAKTMGVTGRDVVPVETVGVTGRDVVPAETVGVTGLRAGSRRFTRCLKWHNIITIIKTKLDQFLFVV